ncbi:energy-coupling factor transporter transmembrane component T [uncultured Pseudodesulfovibrio sp.]|uniref:energy-coupling factor transporter transmembrane component T family protein n=1 Tax=uncultured Pseudodesulfovibrio sp. TaxID=2035858 RepID=UPI0029C7F70A|nr:energy-coupling factor transporter transmembrane component T [uncultured Pseudodesulfovibrio sp.]
MNLWHDSSERRAIFVLPPWLMLILCPVLSLLAVIWHGPWSMPVLAVVEGTLLLISRPGPKRLLRLGMACFWQIAVVTGLYCLRFGPGEWQGGLSVSLRLILVFVPGMLTIRLVPPAALERILKRILPGNLPFVASCCLRFFPLLLERVRIIHEAQVLRGARVLPRELLNPRNWPDAVSCIALPAVLQSIELATEIANSARARGFSMRNRRTSWPLNEEQRHAEASAAAKEPGL